ncbi:MAG: hypothetical protein ABIF09_00685 [Gemmatimonadota bacterium]
MDEGLFFWLIIIAVAVLQGIGRKKKKPGQPGQKPPGPTAPRPGQPRDHGRVTASSRPPMAPPRPGQDEEASGSSEGMIPGDVWAEILGLARGETRQDDPEIPPSSEERPAASAARREEPPPLEERPFPKSHGADAVPHQSKPADFRSRIAASSTPLEVERGDTRDIRTMLFGSGSPAELRKAFILKEVLDPPPSLRKK